MNNQLSKNLILEYVKNNPKDCDPKYIELLLNFENDANSVNNTNLLLGYVGHASNCSSEYIKELLKYNFNINDTSSNNVSILNLYINSFDRNNYDKIDMEIIKLLTPDNINNQCKYGWTVLHAVCNKFPKRSDIIKYLVEECNIDINLTDNNNRIALYKYINRGGIKLEIITLLAPDNINVQCGMSRTILHITCRLCCRLDIVKYLVEDCGIDITIKDNNGKIAYKHISYKYKKAKKYLEDKMKTSEYTLRMINEEIFNNSKELIEVNKNILNEFEKIEKLRNKYKELLEQKNDLINEIVEEELN